MSEGPDVKQSDKVDLATHRKMPENRWAHALIGVGSGVFYAFSFGWVTGSEMGFLGYLVMPLVLGFVSGILVGLRGFCSTKTIVYGAFWFGLGSFGVFLIAAIEGIACMVMAAPLVILGNYVGWHMGFSVVNGDRNRLLPVSLVLVPVLWWVQDAQFGEPEVLATTTETTIDAPPAVVWQSVPEQGELPDSDYLLYRLGVAHPVKTEVLDEGTGALRICELSTGSMPERVTVWEPGRRLEFEVLETPASMKEFNPIHPDTAPEHIHGTIEMVKGRIELIPLEGGRTKVVGTTWSVNHLRPLAYWRLWSDEIIHQTHREVFAVIKARAEGDAQVGR